MSKILFLSQLLPFPPDAGPKVRSYYTLRYLSQQHQITLLAFTRADDKPESIDHLKGFCEAVHTVQIHRSRIRDGWELALSLLSGESFIIRRDDISEMAQKINSLVETIEYDAIHSDQLWMAQYVLKLIRGRKGKAPLKLVLDEHNACFQIFQRMVRGEPNPFMRILNEREWRVLKQYEAKAINKFTHVVTVTEEDRKILDGISKEALLQENDFHSASSGLQTTTLSSRFTTIPICVDTQSVNPITPVAGTQNVLFVGTMFFSPNVEGVLWFANEIWPRVIAQVPRATFSIVGKNPPKVIKDLESVKSSPLPDSAFGSSIRVAGYVDDLNPILKRAAVFIVPLLSGSGMRVKIVDAWRWGLPIVSTSIGAEGIQYSAGENILIADTAEEFAQAVVHVLCDSEFSQNLRQNGRHWVEEHYDWQKVYPAWDAIYGDKNIQ